MVKKTVLSAYGNPRVTGINAINILEGDELIDVQLTDGRCEVMLATRDGMAIRFERRRRAGDGSRHDRRAGDLADGRATS